MTDIANLDMNSGAVISECGQYRYRLWRVWDTTRPRVGFCMLNPSTADAMVDDPTIRRLIGFAKLWGYGGLTVVNLFALRTPKPVMLKTHRAPVGNDNNTHISQVASNVDQMICAWGTHGRLMNRSDAVLNLISQSTSAMALQINADGSPKHPLYIRGDALPFPYEIKRVTL